MRRSLIAASAALAVGGSLALAGTASAGSIPTGSSTDSTNSSLYGLLNQTDGGLIKAQNLIYDANGLASEGHGTPVDANFTTPYSSTPSLTATTVPEIGTDIAAGANTGQLELTICVGIDQAANSGDSTSTAVSNCQAANSPDMAAAVTQFNTTQPEIAAAAGSWAALSSLVALVTADPTDFPGGLYTVDGDVGISSTATVTAVRKPVAYSVTFGVSGAAAKGFVLPSGFSLTFPKDFTVNTALIGDEIQASQESDPPTANAIGTASVTSPEIAALVPGSHGVDSSASVYAVSTATLTQPDFELYLGQGDYVLGTLTGVTFPLTVNFGEPVVGGTATPLPVSSVTMSFPATTSPLQASSCTDLGTLTGTMTDDVSTLASTYFGDSTDGGAQNMTATPTSVTNDCTVTVAIARGLEGRSPIIRVKATSGTAFKTLTIALPKGLSFGEAKAKVLAREVRGAKIRSVRIIRRKLVVALRRAVRSETIQTKRPLIDETAALQRSVKRHKTKELTLNVKVGNASMESTFKA